MYLNAGYTQSVSWSFLLCSLSTLGACRQESIPDMAS